MSTRWDGAITAITDQGEVVQTATLELEEDEFLVPVAVAVRLPHESTVWEEPEGPGVVPGTWLPLGELTKRQLDPFDLVIVKFS